ncbi:GOLPH3/VPS74 family protein [Ornithinimicrobium cerasi]|uniref:Golgi phosphoprotein 3 (GPP34) n=1 Tax=Ornithinimicrobium cerasi TaxID=2248773 RepID=A0A285VSM2_9MICO|nr:GPP34 family phosphoprotein [Ornithinimicrobium cerasi]SOC56943.1 Golgi phosphoprotein 3 (GPP34) [Ornithinimicrobium cerasi]
MLTIAEELLLVATDVEGRNLLSSNRNVALAGAFLSELALRERLTVDERKRLRVVTGGPSGDPLLDQAFALLAERQGRKPKDILEKVGRQLLQPVLDSLVRRELVRPEPVRLAGLTLTTRWPVQTVGARDAALADLVRVITGAAEAGPRTGALVSLLYAVDALPKVVAKELRPGLPNREVKRRGKEILAGRWAPEAVARAVQEAAAAAGAAAAVAASAGGSS